jgi:hypothetical protein
MSYFQRPPVEAGDAVDYEDEPESSRSVGSRLADLGDRMARAFTTKLDPEPEPPALPERNAATGFFGPADDRGGHEEPAMFPIDPLGYSRAAVEARIFELERQLRELRSGGEPASITEELERLGEQTASILVVAHDQAKETTRRAQEQAQRKLADAERSAVSITQRAEQRLRTLDDETDAIWAERERLLEDTRAVGNALIALAQAAQDRFPAQASTPSPAAPAIAAAAPVGVAPPVTAAATDDEPAEPDDDQTERW